MLTLLWCNNLEELVWDGSHSAQAKKKTPNKPSHIILKLFLNHHLLRCYILDCLLEQQETQGFYYLRIREGLICHPVKFMCVNPDLLA